jgi:hypothetical protein
VKINDIYKRISLKEPQFTGVGGYTYMKKKRKKKEKQKE